MSDVSGGFRFQVSNITEFLRYREFYESLKFDIGIGSAPRVLIFGCSSGEELATAYHFWPEAEVSACDVQEDMLAETRRKFPNARVFPSTLSEIAKQDPFDLICANSVFCRNPLPEGPMAQILPFPMVDEYLALLTLRMAEDGVLMVYNSNYFVQDMSCYKNLIPINISRSWTGAFIPRLTRAGKICAHPVMVDNRIVSYSVEPDDAPRDLTHLSCALFRKSTAAAGTAVLNVNAGARPIVYRPILSGALQFPEIADFRTVYMPHFHTASCFVGNVRHSIVETYVTDFVDGGWTLHGLTYETS
jgi:SAM-dependent methyltransferase